MFNVILKKSPQKVLFLQYVFNLTARKTAYTIAHQRTILKGKNPVEVLRPRSMQFRQKIEFYLVTQSL